jgi:predicted DNA-binding ribbon-helix-helix protein
MKKRLSVRVEETRLEKLKKVADTRKKTMTQLIEDWIDRLPNPGDGA